MSRIGKQPVVIPAGVEVKIEGSSVMVKGPKGELNSDFSPAMKIAQEEGAIVVTRPSDTPEHRSLHGLTRSLIYNIIAGVSFGFEKALDIVGVGYKAIPTGKGLAISAGLSHPVIIDPMSGIDFEVPIPTKIIIRGIDKQLVGEVAARIRSIRAPEPYKGKGIKYSDEHVRRKVGKTAK